MKNKILLAFCVLCLCFCTACGGNAYVKPVQPEIDGVTDNREEEVKPSGDSEIKDSVAGGNNTDNDGDNTDNDKQEVKDDGAADGETVSEYTVSTYEDFLAMADDPSANYTLVSD